MIIRRVSMPDVFALDLSGPTAADNIITHEQLDLTQFKHGLLFFNYGTYSDTVGYNYPYGWAVIVKGFDWNGKALCERRYDFPISTMGGAPITKTAHVVDLAILQVENGPAIDTFILPPRIGLEFLPYSEPIEEYPLISIFVQFKR